ncbi:sulfatase-like hydrolase/transferase [Haliscomenobacter hydrossis]|uniref:N-acetylgalactosamine-6-sulfatase n=1 Tax=Haliscomenobacter hydrossis (strain ATCC 27775 / DSM 1100 / LMG 10767 / O) TaxID=760192 RepID=F4L168_HALH1|nr:sulfatase-like hydrolase/transferase [Haliscomenobacter hydrossis]AEE52800.1 N-acetylgalactosamine-6-sulfatase [Haliscomenobacter hydrossis DSM 1100]
MYYLTQQYVKKCLPLFVLTFMVYSTVHAQHPNIIYIMTDDLGYGDLSGYGRKDFLTPNIDKLAAQGIKFVNAYSAAPLCTPTRTAFMTGRYPARTPVGLMEPLTPSKRDSTVGLTAAFPSVATLMRASGYETALIGKWHLGFLPQNSPVKNGFDYFFGIHSGAADYISHKTGPAGRRIHDLYENDQAVYPEGYLTDLFTQKAVTFLKQKHNKPFFLTLTYNAAHWPWQGPNDKPYVDSVDLRIGGSAAVYAAMMNRLDEGIGEIIKTLDEEQLSNQTIVIFTNDNGGEKYSDNGGLAKAKGALWEGGIRVPAIVKWPGKITAGSSTQQVAITMDWTKTILSAGGAKMDKNFPLDGIDLLPILTGDKKIIPRTIYWRTFQRLKQKAIRMGDWKYLQDEKGEYLFNLIADQEEKNDLKAKEEIIFKRLKKKYADWEKTVLQPMPL